MAAAESDQIIARLTPLADVLGLIEAQVRPVAPRTLDIAVTAGRVLAADAVAAARPTAALALIDGWALSSDTTHDAGPYAPAPLLHPPHRLETGQFLPAGTDSMAPLDAVKVENGHAQALAPVAPGNGVLWAGGDCDPALPLRRAGERLRTVDLAAFAAAGLARISVREPRLQVAALRGSSIIAAAARLIAGDAERRGAAVRLEETGRELSTVLASSTADAIIAIGGTGSGRNDASVRLLARQARLMVHGFALTPGETAALGFVEQRPVLLLPGRLDAALAVWLTAGRRLLQQLAAAHLGKDNELTSLLTLARKVVSTIGLAEVVPLRRAGDVAEPLASKYLPFSALTRADGWILVPADSEGYSAGAQVSVSPWP